MTAPLHEAPTGAPLDPHPPEDRLGRALGWVSLGLSAPLLRPAAVTRAIGVQPGPRSTTAAALVGARELTAAAGLLGSRQRAGWLWARVAGDAMDLALLGRALRDGGRRGRSRTRAATAAVAAITAVDVVAATRSTRRRRGRTAVEMHATTTVNKPPKEVYDFWRGLERLPRFMAHVEEVRWTDPTTTHWTVRAPFGRTVEWDARLVDDVPGERLSWRSLDGADIDNEGEVRFVQAPGDRGTEVHATIRYAAPGGKLGELVARLAGEDPHQQAQDDLRRFKQVLETGEVLVSDGAPSGIGQRGFPQSAAQPLEEGDRR